MVQIKQSSDLVKATIAVMDLSLITTAFCSAYWLRFSTWDNIGAFAWLYYFSAPLILFLLLHQGVLTGFRHQSLREILKSSIVAFLIAGIASSTLLYLTKTVDYSRLLFGNYFALATFFILAEKVLVKKLFDQGRKRGGMTVRIAMIGFGRKFDQIRKEFEDRPQWGISPVLVFNPKDADIALVAKKIRNAVVDEVYISYPRGPDYNEQIDALLDRLEKLGLPVRVALNFDELHEYYGQQACKMASNEGILLAPYNLNPDQLIIKRVMDILGAGFGMLLTLIVFPFLALAIKLETPGPIFFSQVRVGKGGRHFAIYKFRSMCAEAAARQEELMEHNIHDGPLFKMENDPRITRIGKTIRKHSLDEFPQFWNVLKGEMSLVGTRPPTVAEVALYEDHHFRRISVRPGLTGLWQVGGRNKVISFEDVVAYDTDYIKNWNLMLDIRIILRTLGVVFFPKNHGGE